MGTAIDMDYCMIVIEKLISPMTPTGQVAPLLRDLMDSVSHPEMKKLAQRIVDPELDEPEKRRLMEQFRNFDHGGANDFNSVDYTQLIDKFLDPNLPDHEYKPTMKALLDGDLDQEMKNMVVNIIGCQDKDRKAAMVKRFKSYFDKEKEKAEKERIEFEKAEKARKAAKAAKEKEKAEMEANLLVFTDDGMTLIMKMINPKIPADKRTQIYDRLMEPDIDAEIKNLAITMLNKKKSEYLQTVEDFKKQREADKLAEIKRKEEAAKKKIEEENALKESKMRRKQELLSKKNKDERMKKRELMLKYRAAERKSFGGGPSSVQEREERQRIEKEKVREEIRRFREKAKLDMMRQEREDRMREGWKVAPFDDKYNVDVQVVVPDLMTSLSLDDRKQFEKALEVARSAMEKTALKDEDKKVEKPAEPPKEIKEESKVKTEEPKPQPPPKDEDDPEFKEYFTIFSNPELSEKDETTHIKKLISDKKSALVRRLVIKLNTVEGAGKSPIFKTLAKKFGKQEEEKPKPEAPTPQDNEIKPVPKQENGIKNGEIKDEKVSSVKSEIPEKSKDDSSAVVNRRPSTDSIKSEAKSDVSKKSENIPNGDRKRRLSTDSTRSNDSKKSENKENKKDNVDNDAESSSGKKKKKHKDKDEDREEKKKKKHKHKDEDKEKDGDEKKKKKHKHKDKHKKKDKEKDKESSENDDKRRGSIDSNVSVSSEKSDKSSKPSKPILEMPYSEIKEMYNLKSIDAFVKIKNCSKLYQQIKRLEAERQKKFEENGKRSRSSSLESSSSSKRQRRDSSPAKSRPSSVMSKKSSRSPSRSKSRSTSRSPVRFVSRTPSRSRSRSISRSRSRSRSVSKSPLRSPSSVKSSSRSRSRSP